MQKWLPRIPFGPSLTYGAHIQSDASSGGHFAMSMYLQSRNAKAGDSGCVPKANTSCERDTFLKRELLEDTVNVCVREVGRCHV